MTRSHEIGLVPVIGGPRRQGRIGGAFRLITAGTPLNQIMPTQNPVDRAQGRQRPDVLVLQLPQDRLGATELGVLVQLEARQLHLLLDRLGRSPGTRPGVVLTYPDTRSGRLGRSALATCTTRAGCVPGKDKCCQDVLPHDTSEQPPAALVPGFFFITASNRLKYLSVCH